MKTIVTEYDNINNALHGLRNSTVAVIDDGHTLLSSLLETTDNGFKIYISFIPRIEE